MTVRSLALPADLASGHPVDVEAFVQVNEGRLPAGCRLSSSLTWPGSGAVVLVLRDVATLLGEEWRRSLVDGPWRSFQAWAGRLGAAPSPSEAVASARWHYDAVVRWWVESVGVDRVTLVLGDDPGLVAGEVESQLGLAAGALEPAPSRRPEHVWPPELVAGFAAQVSRLELGTRVACGLAAQALAGQELRAVALADPPDALLAWTEERARAVELSGVRVVGDPQRLRLSGPVVLRPRVPVSEAVMLGTALLDLVDEDEQTAAARREALAEAADRLGHLQEAAAVPPPEDTASVRELLGALVRRRGGGGRRP